MDNFKYIEWRYLSYGKKICAIKFVKIIDKYFPCKDPILDIGCAAGGLSHFLDKYNYIGLELEHKILEKGKNGFLDMSIFICGDAGHLPIKTNSISSFISSSMLEHTQDPAAIIKEIYRVCNGRGIFVLPCRDTIPFIYDPINYILLKLNRRPCNRGAFGYGHISVLTEDRWQSLIQESGFKIEDILPYDNSFFNQLEFFIFSLIGHSCQHYSDLPVKLVSKRVYDIFDFFHKIAAFFDVETKKSFCKCFLVSK